MRSGPHVPACKHGTPGEIRYECTCAAILARLQHALDNAYFIAASSYVGPSGLRTELRGLLKNIARSEKTLDEMPARGFYSPIGARLIETQNRRRARVEQIRAALARSGAS